MSIVGKKTLMNYVERVETKNNRGRTSIKEVYKFDVKGVLSVVKHTGSGVKERYVAGQVTTNYDYELIVNKRDIINLKEKSYLIEQKNGKKYEIVQVLIVNNNSSNNRVVQLLRLS